MDVKHKPAVHGFGEAKVNHKALKKATFVVKISKRCGHNKINQKVIEYLYHWILHRTQVLKSTVAKNCIYVSIDGISEKQSIQKLLSQVSV